MEEKTMKKTVLIALMGMAVAGIASADNIYVSSSIITSTTWSAKHVYHLRDKVIFVEPGATLLIEPGTLVRGTPESALVVARGAKIYALGTAKNPIIMTSEQDDLKTWRPICEEWGNLTLLGNAMISATKDGNGTGQPDGLDTAQMEGLVARFAGDTISLFGGNDDDDNSGIIQYVSIRYGGKVLSQANELNGMSVGGVGRGTEIDHVEIMNNIDDGIETWGGTVSYKYITIWNIGDDCWDVDMGWRGKLQFGLFVQGYSGTKSQGSGIGDNIFEMDGAESAIAQPYGAASIFNVTAVGQPYDGDYGTAWRDNMRAQFGNCIFMDCGDEVIHDDLSDGEGSGGYGSAGVPTLKDLFNTAYSVYPVNLIGADPKVLYPNFTSGNWCQFADCLFFRNKESASLNTYGQTGAALRNKVADAMPIKNIVRAAPVTVGGKVMALVTKLNPMPASDALTSVGAAPDDGFFTPASYKGAFGTYNWLKGWTACDAYGMIE
jgi:hypothetical protein